MLLDIIIIHSIHLEYHLIIVKYPLYYVLFKYFIAIIQLVDLKNFLKFLIDQLQHLYLKFDFEGLQLYFVIGDFIESIIIKLLKFQVKLLKQVLKLIMLSSNLSLEFNSLKIQFKSLVRC